MIAGKRRLVESEDWWKTNAGVLKERRFGGWMERNKSRQKSKYGSETKVVRKANVGGKQKWGRLS